MIRLVLDTWNELPASNGNDSVGFCVSSVAEGDGAAVAECRDVFVLDYDLTGAEVIVNVCWVVMDADSRIPEEATSSQLNIDHVIQHFGSPFFRFEMLENLFFPVTVAFHGVCLRLVSHPKTLNLDTKAHSLLLPETMRHFSAQPSPMQQLPDPSETIKISPYARREPSKEPCRYNMLKHHCPWPQRNPWG